MRTRAFVMAAQCAVVSVFLLPVAAAAAGGPVPVGLALERWGSMLALVAFQLCLYLNRIDEVLLEPRWGGLVSRSAKSLLEAAAVAAVFFVLAPAALVGAGQALVTMLLSVLLLVGTLPALRWAARHGRMVEGLLILGAGPAARRFYEELIAARPVFAASGRMAASWRTAAPAPSKGVIALDCRKLRAWAQHNGFSRVVVAETSHRYSRELAAALIDCKVAGLRVEQAVDSYGSLRGKLWLAGLCDEFLIYAGGFQPSRNYLWLKRLMDVAGAVLLLALASPVLLLVAIAIKLESPGPVLFSQKRVGLRGRPFILYKFRSMRRDAEQGCGPMWCSVEDDRVTRVGWLIRKFRIDELPQLWNVLRGEMSLIGPRPERPYFVKRLERRIPFYQLRHSIRPGVSGWAQVMYRYGASVEDAYEKLQYDLYYMRNLSLGLDLEVLLRTVKVVLFGHGR